MGTLFMVNPPKRRKSRKRRTAAQKRATAKMIAANKKKRGGAKKRRRTATKSTTTRRKRRTVTMARKRRVKRAAPRRRRRSSAKRRSPVTSLRRHSVYLTNPRRRRRAGRRRVRRNPALFSQLRQGAMDAGATLVGGAVARMATGMLPLPKEGIAGAASGLAVALGVGFAARKVVSHDTARFITAGAMQVPIKNLITSFVPQAGAFLGDYDNIGAYQVQGGDMGNYLSPGMYGYDQQDAVEIGAYE